MPRATGRASQNLIDRIHRQTAKAIDETFRQHSKTKTMVPAPFIAQAIKFLQSTDSTAPERVRRTEPVKAAERAQVVAFERNERYEAERDRLCANGREPTVAEIEELQRKFPEQFGGADLATDFSRELSPSSERQA
jgi:hypothetical protein